MQGIFVCVPDGGEENGVGDGDGDGDDGWRRWNGTEGWGSRSQREEDSENRDGEC